MISKSSLTGPFGLSMAATALIVVFLLISLPSLFTAVFAAGAGSVEPAKTVESLVAKHDESMTAYRERFNGRSVFFKPPPIPAPYRPPPPPEEKPVSPPPPPPPETPPIYGGPSLSAIFGDQAWFKPASASDKIGFILHMGEEKNDVKLLEVDAPWSVKVGHKGGEYTISLPSPMFDKKNTEIVSSTSSKFLLPVPGLGFLKIPVPKPESGGDATTAPASGDGDEVKPLPGDESASGRLQARPLDGRDAAAKPAREATGEEAGDETQSGAAPVEDEVEEAVEEKVEDETAPAPRPDPSPPPSTAPARAAATALVRAK